MESEILLTINALMMFFLYMAFKFKFEFDYVLMLFSSFFGFFLALNVSSYDDIVGEIFLLLLYIFYGLGMLVLSIIRLLESMDKG